MNRILLVEDHERLAALISKQLNTAGIAVDVFEKIDTAWSAFQQIDYQAMVLDRGLPDGEGLSLLKRIRVAGNTIPCLILTARDALHDRVEGLDTGADDYLTKPFAMDELVARVRALLRRPAESIVLAPTFKDITIKPDISMMYCGAESISLAPAELQIMMLLVRKEGNVVRRSALEGAGWGLSEAVTPNALDVALHRLRRKLKAIDSRLELVNMRNSGYALR
ncbi:MAG: response regulator transcription factor [Paraglaciecola sp.]|uniref:response regulator transcription factor n=1 Tax=Paraglaciecola sp. TaxID=1920173 RepID=UPI00273F7F2F|nr:response regulator transcription factor [Paraglaciecola sp.]MDP5029185.1 response regulator transcription factor [Paraglaciecola sp.]MDP5129362.1 response regulator transcription factor [Paraglaciecola sp.]